MLLGLMMIFRARAFSDIGFLHSVSMSFSLLPTFVSLSPLRFFYFEGEPTHLPQLSWSPHPPMTGRPHMWIDDDILTLKEMLSLSLIVHSLTLEIAAYMVESENCNWSLSWGCFFQLVFSYFVTSDNTLLPYCLSTEIHTKFEKENKKHFL